MVKNGGAVPSESNMRQRLGTRWEDLAPLNPRLIYASITAYGEHGEYKHEAHVIASQLRSASSIDEAEALVRSTFTESSGGAPAVNPRLYRVAAERLWNEWG